MTNFSEQEELELLQLLELERQDTARANLTEFSCYVDPNADPAYQERVGENPYRAAHLQQIAQFAQRITETPRGRGIVIVPPRHWKSSQCSEKLPAKYLGDHPDHSLITVTNSESLVKSFSKTVRGIIESPQYQLLYPNVHIQRGSNEVHQWALEQAYRYSYRAAGVETNIMGGGANGLIVDDLFKDWQEGQSQTIKDSRWDWLTKTAFNRLEAGAWVLVVCTRWAVDDHVGRIKQEMAERGTEHWDILNLEIDDGDAMHSGEPLWGERFDRDEIANIKTRPGATPYYINLVYYGKTELPEGDDIKRDWFEYVPHLPIGAKWKVRAWDVAWTVKQTKKHDPDFTATVKGCVFNDVLYLGEPRLFRKPLEDLATDIVTAKMAELDVRYGMGQNANKATFVTAMNNAGFAIEKYEEQLDPIANASGWIPRAATGHVKLVGTIKEWEPFMELMMRFPSGHDDPIAAITGVAHMLNFVFMSNPSGTKSTTRPAMDEALRNIYG